MAKLMPPMSMVLSTPMTIFPIAVSHLGNQPALRLREKERVVDSRLNQQNVCSPTVLIERLSPNLSHKKFRWEKLLG